MSLLFIAIGIVLITTALAYLMQYQIVQLVRGYRGLAISSFDVFTNGIGAGLGIAFGLWVLFIGLGIVAI
jgi:hypothetical protein